MSSQSASVDGHYPLEQAFEFFTGTVYQLFMAASGCPRISTVTTYGEPLSSNGERAVCDEELDLNEEYEPIFDAFRKSVGDIPRNVIKVSFSEDGALVASLKESPDDPDETPVINYPLVDR